MFECAMTTVACAFFHFVPGEQSPDAQGGENCLIQENFEIGFLGYQQCALLNSW